VKSTEQGQYDSPQPLVPDEPLELDDALEVVRQSFYARLHDEKTRLAALATSLESSEAESATVFEQMEVFAHRLRGAAAVFGAFELSDAAKALEWAASAASAEGAQYGDASVWYALNLLASQLASLTDRCNPPGEI
jgi:HPt (histidine-containing phosphotransfer) domain-containing protein